MKNMEIAKLFYEMADILEMKGVDWKPAAFRKAARSIETLSGNIEDLAQENRLDEIPGVGEKLSEKIIEYITTGKIKEREELLKSVPKEMTLLMQIPGMGPKKVKVLYQKLGIKSVEQLQKAAEQHKLAKLSGFGEKSEENILRGIGLLKSGQERMLLGYVEPLAMHVVNELKKHKEVNQITIAGSMRRMSQTVGDIDILITSAKPEPIMDAFTTLPEVKTVLAKGPTKSTVIFREGIQADVRIIPEKCFGAALQYFTGNKYHNISLRNIAIKKGYKLSEYGLFEKKTDKFVVGKTEKEVYDRLGLPYIEPELRENTGEIENTKKLPKLIEYDSIKGDLHAHTTYSDGGNTVREMVSMASQLGYEYIAITDHSQSQKIANGLDYGRLQMLWKEIDKVQNDFSKIKILKGSEVDIKSDGTLDYSNKILKELDIVVASIHLGFAHDNTQRILNAMDNEYTTIIGHPTGKLYGQREAYKIDFVKIFERAKKTGKFIEVDAQPERTDLNDMHIKEAVQLGVKLSIDSDAHSTEQMRRYMRYGIGTARRGWATSNDVINTLPWNKFKKIIKK